MESSETKSSSPSAPPADLAAVKLTSGAPPTAATEAPQIVSGKKRCWERRKGETSLAYEYAFRYITMGPGRSIAKASKKPRVSRHLKRWSSQWQWVKRAAAWDRWREAKNLAAAELFAAEEAKKWEQRERERRERVWQRGEKHGAAGDLILNFPLTEVKWVKETDAEGRATVFQIIKPVGFVKRDAIRFHKCWDEMTGAAIANEGAVFSATDVPDKMDKIELLQSQGKRK